MGSDTTSTVVLELSDSRPEGARMGRLTTDYISFLGATPVARQTAPTALTPASDTTATISTAVNLMRTAMVNYGLIA
jgi:hypothetical protein